MREARIPVRLIAAPGVFRRELPIELPRCETPEQIRIYADLARLEVERVPIVEIIGGGGLAGASVFFCTP